MDDMMDLAPVPGQAPVLGMSIGAGVLLVIALIALFGKPGKSPEPESRRREKRSGQQKGPEARS